MALDVTTETQLSSDTTECAFFLSLPFARRNLPEGGRGNKGSLELIYSLRHKGRGWRKGRDSCSWRGRFHTEPPRTLGGSPKRQQHRANPASQPAERFRGAAVQNAAHEETSRFVSSLPRGCVTPAPNSCRKSASDPTLGNLSPIRSVISTARVNTLKQGQGLNHVMATCTARCPAGLTPTAVTADTVAPCFPLQHKAPRLQPRLSTQALARPPPPPGASRAAGRRHRASPIPLGAAILCPPRTARAPPSCALPMHASAMAGLLCRLLLCLAAVGATAADLQLEEARRTVDLSTHLAKVSAELSLANAPGGPAASSFLLALEPGLEPRLAYLGVQVSAGSGGEPRESGGPRHGPGLQGHVGTAPRPGAGPAGWDTSAAGGWLL